MKANKQDLLFVLRLFTMEQHAMLVFRPHWGGEIKKRTNRARRLKLVTAVLPSWPLYIRIKLTKHGQRVARAMLKTGKEMSRGVKCTMFEAMRCVEGGGEALCGPSDTGPFLEVLKWGNRWMRGEHLRDLRHEWSYVITKPAPEKSAIG